jgi:riboflavin synthase
MFTGIIEAAGTVRARQREGSNIRFTIAADLAEELRVDQSLAHNGACLTVERVHPEDNCYEVVAIAETLQRTNLGSLQEGNRMNLERCLRADARMDGHFVQGHVDCVAKVTEIQSHEGSWSYYFAVPAGYEALMVEKGSITVNGVSLTIVEAGGSSFSVAIIPYTYEHTNFHELSQGSPVNIEFDVLGKYVQRLLARQTHSSD